MNELDRIGDSIVAYFEIKNEVRENVLSTARQLTRQCANTIRSIHRMNWEEAKALLGETQLTVLALRQLLQNHPDLYHTGYTQDALKEYVEAQLMYAFVRGEAIPTPEALDIIPSTYINGMAEAATELRRHILDLIRQGNTEKAEQLLDVMDTVYTLLITMDFSDAITGGLRRRTDVVRSVAQNTRADVTLSLRQQRLERGIEALLQKLTEQK
ncbi:MAG: haloacid dehalogenase [Anaerolineae bacterium]|nr:haloacid dehalogenase [Anaerolineae bacterium]